MLEVEIQKLTAAVEALTAELRSAKVGNSLPTEISTITDNYRQDDQSCRENDAAREKMQAERTAKRKPRVTKEEAEALIEVAKPVENPVVTDQPLKDEPKEVVSDITAEDLKTMAMEIARADSSTRTIILEILGEHGAKTISQLDPKNYRAVHGRLLSLATDIAKDGAPF